MKIRVGVDIVYEFAAPTSMVLMLNVHPSRKSDLIKRDVLRFSPAVPTRSYIDGFGNLCTRLVAPKGDFQITTDANVADSGLPDELDITARQHDVAELPDEALVFLLGSRYCETEPLMNMACVWQYAGGLAARAGDLRFCPVTCPLRLSVRARDQNRCRSVGRALRRLPRLYASGRDTLPLHEHSGALLHRLSRRYRRATTLWPNGFRGLVRSLS
jgi:hypothetical protein